MTAEIPQNNPENEVALDDNALKFRSEGIPAEFLQAQNAHSFLLTTDWLEMNEKSEKKLACKQRENGEIEFLLIEKFTDENGNRTVPPKKKLTQEKYEELLNSGLSVRRVEKMRYEFDYVQNGTTFSMKYDKFVDSELRILEVDVEDDSETDPERHKRDDFKPSDFPYPLTSVTGKPEYYGYRVADLV